MKFLPLLFAFLIAPGCGNSPVHPDPLDDAALVPVTQDSHGGPHPGVPVRANLTYDAVVPSPGDLWVTGFMSARFANGQDRVCWALYVYDHGVRIVPTTVHIHAGTAGQPETRLVADLSVPAEGTVGDGCTSLAAGDAKAVAQDPANYFVDVHTAGFPAGAIRGQFRR